jgi:hypothetical protein
MSRVATREIAAISGVSVGDTLPPRLAAGGGAIVSSGISTPP